MKSLKYCIYISRNRYSFQFSRLFTNLLTSHDKFTRLLARNNLYVAKYSGQRSTKFQGALFQELRSQSHEKFKTILYKQPLAAYMTNNTLSKKIDKRCL